MSIQVIEQRLHEYQPNNQLEEENALKEITQEIALAALSRAGFFKFAAFQGGTCLRIIHGLNRFSEDLDFSLQSPNSSFRWEPYLKALKTELEVYGYQIEIEDRSMKQNPVKTGFLKDDSIGKILSLRHRSSSLIRSIKVKFEIDTNPPQGGTTEQKYIDFPVTTPILCHDLSSLFAGKSHALLCRNWEKGRDWYDFSWYVGKKVTPNFVFLNHAINQMGPFQGHGIQLNPGSYVEKLREKIHQTNWEKQKQDIVRFLKLKDTDLLNYWSSDFFIDRLNMLENYL